MTITFRHLLPDDKPADPLVAVIDHQLEIERKARAWDALYERYRRWPSLTDRADEMDDILAKSG